MNGGKTPTTHESSNRSTSEFRKDAIATHKKREGFSVYKSCPVCAEVVTCKKKKKTGYSITATLCFHVKALYFNLLGLLK